MATTATAAFDDIYKQACWGAGVFEGLGSSGGGSDPRNAAPYLSFLHQFILDHNVKKIVDLGHGDWTMLSALQWPELRQRSPDLAYVGYDCVPALTKAVSEKYANETTKFVGCDFSTDFDAIEEADLCLLKDVLQHWPSETVTTFLTEIIQRKLFKYILITNCCDQPQDRKVEFGGWSPLSPTMLPLSQFDPIVMLRYDTKAVCLVMGGAN